MTFAPTLCLRDLNKDVKLAATRETQNSGNVDHLVSNKDESDIQLIQKKDAEWAVKGKQHKAATLGQDKNPIWPNTN